MKSNPRLVWIPCILFASAAVAEQRASERVADAAFAEMAETMERRLQALDSALEAEIDAKLEAAAEERIASRIVPPWVSPPFPAIRVRPLPARRATVLADTESGPGEPGSIAPTAARTRAGQEPFGG